MNLSDDDKKWFETQLGGLRAANEAYIDARLQDQRAYIDARLQDQSVSISVSISAAIEAVETRLLTELHAQMQEQRIALEAVETRLLTEFHKWASPIELRIQSHAQAIRAIDLELENVKERVSKLEPKQ